jgi:hypothetical protein
MRRGGGGGPFEEAQVAGVVMVRSTHTAHHVVIVDEAVLEVLVARHLDAIAIADATRHDCGIAFLYVRVI